MSDWHDVANRGLSLLSGDSSDEATRTVCILKHVLVESKSDMYISKDFFNVQQTAGGLPPDITMDQFIDMIAGHVRGAGDSDPGLGGSSFDGTLPDNDVRSALLTFDDMIRRHIRFLNGVVHQAAPGDVHVALWNLILAALNDPNSIYGDCYKDFITVT
jgi:hypothetical protein